MYKAGDTYAESGTSLNGLVRNNGKQITLRVTVPKMLSAVSSVSVTALTGWMHGMNGIIGNSGNDTNWLTMSGVTVRAVKKSDNIVIIAIDSDTALNNEVNGPVCFWGNVTLTFA